MPHAHGRERSINQLGLFSLSEGWVFLACERTYVRLKKAKDQEVSVYAGLRRF